MTEVVPAWVIILATVAGMVTSVLMAWAAIRAQIIQPLISAIIHDVIDALKPDIERWDLSETVAHATAETARVNAEHIVAVKETVEDTQRAVEEIGRRGDERHRRLDGSIARIENHLLRQDVTQKRWHDEDSGGGHHHGGDDADHH